MRPISSIRPRSRIPSASASSATSWSPRRANGRSDLPRITTIAFDADDTLWQNEHYFRLTEQRFAELLSPYTDAPDLIDRLIAATTRNLRFYGFGMKGFALSMVETALEVTDHRVPGPVIAEILAAGRELLTYPIETLPHVDQALAALERDYRLLLVTKGDIFDQERKLA